MCTLGPPRPDHARPRGGRLLRGPDAEAPLSIMIMIVLLVVLLLIMMILMIMILMIIMITVMIITR